MVCLFVDFSLRENGRQTKVLQKKPFVPFGTVFTHPGKVQRRFAHFNSFRFSDTEASFLYFMLFHEQRQVLEIQILNLELKVFFGFCVLVILAPFTQVPRHQNCNKIWWRTYPAAQRSNLYAPTEELRPRNTYQGLFDLAFLFVPYTYRFDDYMTSVPFS